MSSSGLSLTDWARVEQLLQQSVKDTSDDVVRRLEASIHRASTETKLLRYENAGLRASLATKNKRRSHGKHLPLAQAESTGGGAFFWSPRKVQEARVKCAEMDHQKHQEKLKKVEMKALGAANKLYKQKIAEEKRAERERAKGVREKEKAAKAAEQRRQREERNLQKAIQTPQRGKRRGSQAPAPKNKRRKASGSSAAAPVPVQPVSALPVLTTSHGRNVHLSAKFR
jgi:hypothetical protein